MLDLNTSFSSSIFTSICFLLSFGQPSLIDTSTSTSTSTPSSLLISHLNMNLQMTDLKREDGYIPRRSSDGSSSSKATSNTTTDHLKGYHLPYHTSDIKESSPFLTPNEEDEEEAEGRAYGREGERMTLQKKTGSVRRFSPNLSFLLPSSKRKSLAIILILVIVIMVCNTITHPTPDYDLLPASKYHAILNQSISKSFPDHMKPRLALELNQKDLPSSRPGRRGEAQGLSSSQSLMPSTLFQTDKKASKLVEVERSWDQAGARRVFLDDKGAWDFIHRNYNSSEIWDVYEFLPIPVLKSDFLRYSALLAEGGIYSDMDTRVLMPIEQWWKGAQVFTPKTSGSSHSLDNRLDLNSSSSSSPTETWHEAENPKRELQREAVRFLVGIENDSKLWHSVRNIAEALWLLPLNRHRPLQFVQWTLQSAPNHPILVDTLRRIVNTSHFAKALMIEREREANFYEAKGNIKKAEKVRKEAFPWNGLRGKEFERTGVEEWTGPGAFTDAVMSYLNAVAGLKKSDLQKLKQPLQVRDVVILPSSGFNPFESQLPNPMARVVHLFRGSWK